MHGVGEYVNSMQIICYVYPNSNNKIYPGINKTSRGTSKVITVTFVL